MSKFTDEAALRLGDVRHVIKEYCIEDYNRLIAYIDDRREKSLSLMDNGDLFSVGYADVQGSEDEELAAAAKILRSLLSAAIDRYFEQLPRTAACMILRGADALSASTKSSFTAGENTIQPFAGFACSPAEFERRWHATHPDEPMLYWVYDNDNRISLKEARKKAGMTQIQAAHNIGCQQKEISMWESGTRKPNLENVKKLACLYGCSTDDLDV